jgi:hypothetical protein
LADARSDPEIVIAACLETTDDVAGVGLIVDLDKTARFH